MYPLPFVQSWYLYDILPSPFSNKRNQLSGYVTKGVRMIQPPSPFVFGSFFVVVIDRFRLEDLCNGVPGIYSLAELGSMLYSPRGID